jgi:hypothetical protein
MLACGSKENKKALGIPYMTLNYHKLYLFLTT